MKRTLIVTLCFALAGCATAPAREAKTCETGGIAAGAGHMLASGNIAAAAVGGALIGLTVAYCRAQS